jgi:prepilin-type N-terminal cleavage/methylation domain-containing protein
LPHRGFTLVETLVAIVCMSILMVPIVWVYRSGSRSAFEGMVKADITLEARRIIRQIQDDLKYSVFVLDYSKVPDKRPEYFFNTIVTGNAETVYRLLRFPIHGSVNSMIDFSEGAFRKPTPVSYELAKIPDSPLYTLTRSEGGSRRVILSEQVNFFEIRPNPLAPDRTSWAVTLQLAKVAKAKPTDSSLLQLEAHQTAKVKATERRLLERTRGVQIADFYTVVASEYYHLFRRSRFIPNWHTLLVEP